MVRTTMIQVETPSDKKVESTMKQTPKFSNAPRAQETVTPPRRTRLGLLSAGAGLGALAMAAMTQATSVTAAQADEAGQGITGAATALAGAQALPQSVINDRGLLSFADVVESVSPSVVSVLVERSVELPRGRPQVPPGFERFFGFPEDQQEDNDDPFREDNNTRRAEAQGSGFFIDKKGHIVTNNHVVEDAESVRVRLSDGREVDAEIVGTDAFTDLAVLKVKPQATQSYVEFAEKESLRVGDWVVAVGNPFGLGGTVTSGIVSAIGGQNREQQYVDLIQIDAAINRGNSGGPAFDLTGRVIGINVAIYSPNGGSVGIGFAIPADTAKATIAQLIENGTVTRGWLGIALGDVDEALADALSLSSTDGVLVEQVQPDTPAQAGGVENGDVITSIDGKAVNGPNDLSRRIANYPPGRKIKIGLVRDGRTRNVTVTLGKRDEEQTIAALDPSVPEESVERELGVRISSITPALRERYRLDEDATGVVVTAVKAGSAAEEAGLRTGVVIAEVENQKIRSPGDFEDRIAAAKKSSKGAALLRLQRGTVKQYSALKLGDD
ncbi:MAG: Do family serine endopeptidase [Pseudomonadota bacterium]